MKKTAFLSLFLALVLMLASTALAQVNPNGTITPDLSPGTNNGIVNNADVDSVRNNLPGTGFIDIMIDQNYDELDLRGITDFTNVFLRCPQGANVTITKLITPVGMNGLTIRGQGMLTIDEWEMGDNSSVSIRNTNTLVTVKKLITPATLSKLEIDGKDKLTINKWDIGSGDINIGNIKINNVNFGNNDGISLFVNHVAPKLTGPVAFTDCVFTSTLRWPDTQGPHTITITDCDFIGAGLNITPSQGASVHIIRGTVTDCRIYASGSATGTWIISDVKFMNNSNLTLNGVINATIDENEFIGTPAYGCGIGIEMSWEQNETGNVIIKNNVFWNGQNNVGVAIAYLPENTYQGANPQKPSANNIGSISIDNSNNFTGATFGFKDLWGGSDKSKLTIADDNMNRPLGRAYDEFFDLVKPVVTPPTTTTSSSGIHWYPPDPKSPAPNNDVPYAAVTGIGSGETRAKIPVYISSKLSGKKAGTLAKGDEFNILAVSGKAARIETDSYEGYVALSKINAAFSAYPLAMTTRKATVYEQPSAKSKYKIGTIAKNTEIEIIAWAGAWAQIRFENADGEVVEAWIQVKDIKFVV